MSKHRDWFGADDPVTVTYKGKAYEGTVKRVPPATLHAWMNWAYLKYPVDFDEQVYDVTVTYQDTMSGTARSTTLTLKARHLERRRVATFVESDQAPVREGVADTPQDRE